MCNAYRLRTDAAAIFDAFAAAGVRLAAPEGVPNLEPRDDVRITDPAPIVRAGEGGEGAVLVQRRWSWPGGNGRPVYNFRSDGRTFGANRCLVVTEGFYEFTTPTEPGRKRKDKWLFTRPGEPLLCIAGIWRAVPGVGEAFTMLTMPPGPDIAPYHDRQVVVLAPEEWAGWLDPSVPAAGFIRPLPAGTLRFEPVAG